MSAKKKKNNPNGINNISSAYSTAHQLLSCTVFISTYFIRYKFIFENLFFSILGEKPTNELFGSSYLNREWEIVTVEEVCRRLSLDHLENLALPIPEGATSSQILDEPMIRKVFLYTLAYLFI